MYHGQYNDIYYFSGCSLFYTHPLFGIIIAIIIIILNYKQKLVLCTLGSIYSQGLKKVHN